MGENVENLILEHLRGLRSGQDRMENELREIKARITSLEAGVAGFRRDTAHDRDDIVRQQVSLDQLNERIQRIEKRLELANN